MKHKAKQAWLWIALGSAVVLLVFCAIWAFYPRAGGTKATPETVGTAAGNPRSGPTNPTLTPTISHPIGEGGINPNSEVER
jgi:hypothetical protein